MSEQKFKVRSRKQIRNDLKQEIENDEKNRSEVNVIIKRLIEYCSENDVQPETVIKELSKAEYTASRVFMTKHKENIVSKLGHEPSNNEMKKIGKDFDRAMGEQMRFSYLSRGHTTALISSNSSSPRPPECRRNEEMPCVPSNERLEYIR